MLCLFQRWGAKALISSSVCWVIPLRCRDGRVTAEGSTQRVRELRSDGFHLHQHDFKWKHFASVFSADDTTGIKSIYTVYQGHELMFHVSTMLPYSKENKQQVGGCEDACLSCSTVSKKISSLHLKWLQVLGNVSVGGRNSCINRIMRTFQLQTYMDIATLFYKVSWAFLRKQSGGLH